MVRPLNMFEDAEFRLDSASLGNLNFSVISSYKGNLNAELVQKGLKHLQKIHPLLRMSQNSTQKVTHFIETATSVPFKEYQYEGQDQWKSIVKRDLAERFNKLDTPLWRVILLKGEEEGQLLITFHHAIADGVCAMEMVNHLFRFFSDFKKGNLLEVSEFNQIPDLNP